MKKIIFYGSLLGLVLIIAEPLMAKGNEGRPVRHWKLSNKTVILFNTDSLPTSPKSTGKITDKPVADNIKSVPKARNQVVPMPITQQIKPIKMIKPIIRPVIKVLH